MKNAWKFLRIALGLLVLAILLFLVVRIYLGEPDDALTKSVAKTLHLPVAIASGDFITFNEYYARQALAEKVQKKPLASARKDDLIDQMVNDALVRKLLTEKKIIVSPQEVEQYYQFLKKVTFTNNFDFKDLEISDEHFKDLVVAPELNRSRLQIALAQDRELNREAYQLADRLQKLLEKGAKFSDLVVQYSADAQSAKIGGEMGFVGYKDVVSEIYEQLKATPDRNPRLMASRYGLHLYIVTSADQKGPEKTERFNFKQIFIKTADFEQWFAQQKKSSTIIRLK